MSSGVFLVQFWFQLTVTSYYNNKNKYELNRIYRYGGCFKTRIFGETHVFVSSTEWAKLILNDGGGRFTKKYIKSIAELVGHQSLLCAPHLHHKFLRSRLINLFSSCFLASFVPQFDRQIVETFQRWESGSTIFVLTEALKVFS